MHRKHLLTNTWILFINTAVSLRVLDWYNNTDVTFEENILSFVFNDMEVVCHTGLSNVNACLALLMHAFWYLRMCHWFYSTDNTTQVLKFFYFFDCLLSNINSTVLLSHHFQQFVLLAFIFNPTFSPAAFRSSLLQRIKCSLLDNSPISSANSRSSKVFISCHRKPLSDNPYASVVTQSRTIRKRRGESRHPCLMPVSIWIFSVNLPLCMTCALNLHKTSWWWTLTIFVGTSLCLNSFHKVSLWLLPKAFWKSTKYPVLMTVILLSVWWWFVVLWCDLCNSNPF